MSILVLLCTEFDPGKGDLVFSQKGELGYNGKKPAFHVKNLGARIPLVQEHP